MFRGLGFRISSVLGALVLLFGVLGLGCKGLGDTCTYGVY